MIKTVTIECDLPDGYEAVRFGYPKIGEQFLWKGMVTTACVDFQTETCLIVRPIPPKQVPLGPEDVIPGVTLISREKWSVSKNGIRECCAVEYRGETGFRIGLGTGACFMTFEDAMNDGDPDNRWLYSNDHGKTWQPCSKPA